MKARLATLACFVLAFGAALTSGACGASNKSTFMTPIDAGGTSPDDDAMMPAGDASMMTLNQDASGSYDACTGTHCSADLHNLVDCSGNVVKACTGNTACSPSGCIAPCDAAAADKSTIGCDYFSVTPDTEFPSQGGCFAAYVANTWNAPVAITVDYNGMSLNPAQFAYTTSGTGQSIKYTPLTGTLPAGQVAILFLNNVPSESVLLGLGTSFPPGSKLNVNCPMGITPAITTQDTAQHGTGIGHAFHIATSAPVVAYDIYPYGGGESALTSATLLLPTSSWDTNYIAVDGYAAWLPTGDDAAPFNWYSPFVDFVAEKDGTTITINPAADILGGTGVSVATQGQPTMYGPFNRGEVLHIVQPNELIGSIVQSNYPIGSWGGHECMHIATSVDACDTAHQQIPPVHALGNEYVGVHYRNRWQGTEETVPWRLVGAVNGTTLSYEPSVPPGAPTTLSAGQMVEFDSTGYFVVRSQDAQHPFYMAGFMTGADTFPMAGTTDGRGDPEFVNVIPTAEYLNSYTFLTDPTYPETNLVVIRSSSSGKFEDVTLDCLGTVTGWQPLGTSGLYEYTRVDLSTGDFQAQGSCNNGRHVMSSKTPFGLTVWGWGSAASGLENNGGFYSQFVSYAYPAGQSVAPINTVVVPPVPQ